MSHVVTIKVKNVQITNKKALFAACQRLKLAEPEYKTFETYSESLEGWAIQLNGWKYPIAVNLETGEVKGDNYHGQWGKAEEIVKLEAAYAAESEIITARESHRYLDVIDTVEENGDIVILCVEEY